MSDQELDTFLGSTEELDGIWYYSEGGRESLTLMDEMVHCADAHF